MSFAPLISSTHRVTLIASDPGRMAWVVSALQADGLVVSIDTHGNNPENLVPDLVIFSVQEASRAERDMWHALKAHPLTAPVPVLFLYADAEVAQLWRATNGSNCNNFRIAPVSRTELTAWVKACRVSYGLAFDDDSELATIHRSAGDQAVVRAAKSYLIKHHAKAVNAELIASALKINTARLTEVFYASQGMTLAEFQTQERIRHAQRLLLQSSLSMSAIATAVGYSTAAQLTTAFRKLTGLTPGAYRRNSGAESLTIQGAMRWSSM